MTTVLKMHQWPPALTMNGINAGVLDCGFYTIYPDLAAELLANRNPTNRAIKVVKLGQLISDVKNGNFTLNGETIIFSDSGNLLNGQHRLTAVVETGVPISSVVVTGIQSQARETMDQGKTRGAGDVLQMETETSNGNVFAAILRGYVGYHSSDKTTFGRVGHISRGALLEAAKDNPCLGEISEWAGKFKGVIKGVISSSQLGVARAILEPVYGDEVVYFLERVAQGDGLSIDSPGFAVRRRLMGASGRVTMLFAIECVMRGAIAHMEGRPLSRMQLDGKLPLLKKAML